MLVIGTAGHIDHGKSAVVKRLTGTDPDRLPEEKSRGMTIDLGFAFQASEDRPLAFVDVPGHERFVKNMIAGAGGIDAVMLVVAADDGWMPQSEEHFQIVRLLGVEHGLIVLNKTDLAEPEWVELQIEDIREKVAGSFLKEAPIVPVSAATGEGFDELQRVLDHLPERVQADRDHGRARLYIDRSFVLLGIGGVVTGTLREGELAVGQTVSVWPSQSRAKIRSLRANNAEVEVAFPGQRTAVSFSGLDKDELVRGGVVFDVEDLSHLERHPVLALAVEMLPDARVELSSRRRVVVIIGTTEVEGEIRVFQTKAVNAGEKGIVFFRPDDPTLALVGDHFIMRLPTPMVTLGGGRVLDHLERFPRRKDLSGLGYLTDRISFTAEDLILTELRKRLIVPPDELLRFAAVPRRQIEPEVERLVKAKTLGTRSGKLFEREALASAIDRLRAPVEKFLSENSHLSGVKREKIVQLSPFDETITRTLIDQMVRDGALVAMGNQYNLVGRGVSLKGKVKKAHDQIIAELGEAPYNPPKLNVLAGRGKDFREAIKYMLEAGTGYKAGADFVFLTETWVDIVRYIKAHLAGADSLTVADLKEQFGLTRKWAIPILEETDRRRLTKRDGDMRVKGDRFEGEEFDL